MGVTCPQFPMCNHFPDPAPGSHIFRLHGETLADPAPGVTYPHSPGWPLPNLYLGSHFHTFHGEHPPDPVPGVIYTQSPGLPRFPYHAPRITPLKSPELLSKISRASARASFAPHFGILQASGWPTIPHLGPMGGARCSQPGDPSMAPSPLRHTPAASFLKGRTELT